MAVVVQTTLNKIVQYGLLPEDARIEISVDAARELDRELKQGPARDSDTTSDDFVNFNFQRTWRQGRVPPKSVFGTDYDYYNVIADQVKFLWMRWTGGADDPDTFGHNAFAGVSPKVPLSRSLGIWQNGTEVTFSTPLEGPQIDIGPKVDYGLFLEKWKTGRNPVAFSVILANIGAIHAIASRLNADWSGAHHIYAAVSKPGGKGPDFSPITRRLRTKKQIELFPFVRIQPRHR